jgi:hypothetical protein
MIKGVLERGMINGEVHERGVIIGEALERGMIKEEVLETGHGISPPIHPVTFESIERISLKLI